MTAKRTRIDPKEAILSAAELILVEEGYGAITTRRLASRAGVNQALVHYHFGSIDGVFQRVLGRVAQRADAINQEIFDSDSSDLTKWHEHFATVFSTNVDNGLVKMWIELIAMSMNNDEMRDFICKRQHEVLDMYRVHLEELQGSTPSLAGVSTDGLAALVQALVYGVFIDSLLGFDRGRNDAIEALHALLDLAASPVATRRR